MNEPPNRFHQNTSMDVAITAVDGGAAFFVSVDGVLLVLVFRGVITRYHHRRVVSEATTSGLPLLTEVVMAIYTHIFR